jgi:hypothetical protein
MPSLEPDADKSRVPRQRDRRLGCPYGCRSKPGYVDDPDCLRHQPLGCRCGRVGTADEPPRCGWRNCPWTWEYFADVEGAA